MRANCGEISADPDLWGVVRAGPAYKNRTWSERGDLEADPEDREAEAHEDTLIDDL